MRISHEFLDNIVDAIAEPVFVKDRQHRWVQLNEAFCRFIGYPREELLGKSDFHFFPKHEACIFWDKDEAVFNSGEENINEEEITDSKGIRHIIVTKKSIFTDSSGESFIVGIIRDVTEQKLAQESLAKREQEFRTLAENMPDVIVRYDADCRRTYANTAWNRINGIPIEDAIGKSPVECSGLTAPQAAEYLEEIREVIVTGQSADLSFTVHDAHGQSRFFDVRAVPEFDEDGNVVSVLTVARDITERKHLEDQLAAREQEFRSLAESVPNSIIRYDLEHRILYLNNHLVNDLGLASADEVIGRRPIEIWPDGRFSAIDEAAKRVIDSGDTEIIELVWESEPGQIHVGDVHVVPERNINGEIIGTIAYGHDTTAIRESERRLKHFIESLPGMAYTFRLAPDGEMSFPYVSTAIEEFYGLTPDEAMSDVNAMHGRAHPEDRQAIEAVIDESAQSMSLFHIETRICPSGQPERWLDVRAIPERQHDGSILWHGIMLDISERKQVEAELKKQVNFHQTLLNGLNDMGMQLMVIENGRLIHIGNHEIAHEFGYSDDELDAHPPLTDIIHPDDRDRVMDYYSRRMAGEVVSNSYELGLVTRYGERREYETSAAIVPNTDPMRVITIGKDITKRKLADAERRRLAEVLEESVDFVGWADMEGRLQYHNRAARQMIGLPEDSDISSMQLSDMHPEWALKMIEEVAMPIVFERGMWRGESVLLHRDGREIPVSQMIMLHRDANGQPVCTSTIMQDISERKATEFVRETALKEANRLAQMRGTFMSQMSHELRTPLNGILGCVQLLQMDENLDEEQAQWTNFIRSSGEYLLLLVNDILDYSKLEADKIEIHAEETELDTLLEAIIGIVRINAEQKGLAFNFKPDSDLPGIVRCDGLRLRQILLNLLSNAVKFTDQGHVSLHVRFLPPGILRFEVEDSGIGISEDEIENIFQPYTQVGDAHRHAAGTGLGLAISRQLVVLMGGEIKVDSRPGQGSIFFINLPVEIVQAAPMELNSLQIETSPKTSVEPSLPITTPPSDMLDALYSLALRGNMRAIITFARYLTEVDDSYFDFADHVRRMAKAYESKNIVDFVAKSLEAGAGHG